MGSKLILISIFNHLLIARRGTTTPIPLRLIVKRDKVVLVMVSWCFWKIFDILILFICFSIDLIVICYFWDIIFEMILIEYFSSCCNLMFVWCFWLIVLFCYWFDVNLISFCWISLIDLNWFVVLSVFELSGCSYCVVFCYLDVLFFFFLIIDCFLVFVEFIVFYSLFCDYFLIISCLLITCFCSFRLLVWIAKFCFAVLCWSFFVRKRKFEGVCCLKEFFLFLFFDLFCFLMIFFCFCWLIFLLSCAEKTKMVIEWKQKRDWQWLSAF